MIRTCSTCGETVDTRDSHFCTNTNRRLARLEAIVERLAISSGTTVAEIEQLIESIKEGR